MRTVVVRNPRRASLEAHADGASGAAAGSADGLASCGPVCPKCKDSITKATLAATTQARKRFAAGQDCDCNECTKNYKGITRRWRTNKKLQVWFAGLTEDERVDWYRKEKVKSSQLSAVEKRVEKLKLKVLTRSTQKRSKKNAERLQLNTSNPEADTSA